MGLKQDSNVTLQVGVYSAKRTLCKTTSRKWHAFEAQFKLQDNRYTDDHANRAPTREFKMLLFYETVPSIQPGKDDRGAADYKEKLANYCSKNVLFCVTLNKDTFLKLLMFYSVAMPASFDFHYPLFSQPIPTFLIAHLNYGNWWGTSILCNRKIVYQRIQPNYITNMAQWRYAQRGKVMGKHFSVKIALTLQNYSKSWLPSSCTLGHCNNYFLFTAQFFI